MAVKTHTITEGAYQTFLVKRTIFFNNIRHFAENYRLPLVMTLVFLLIIFGLAAVRLSERTSLIGLLPGVSGGGQGYSTLLIADEPDEFTKASTGDTAPETSESNGNSTGNSTSFTISPDEESSSGGSNNQGGGSAKFSVSLAYFQRGTVSLDCINPSKPNKGTCSKRYLFTGGVRTSNGPGTVGYSWRSNLQNINSSASFLAPSGSSLKVLSKQILLDCKKSGDNSLQLVINSPVFIQSATINFNHNCDDL